MIAASLLAALLAAAPSSALDTLAAAASGARDEAPLRRSGLFGVGVALQPITFGVVQEVSQGEAAAGIQLMAALQVDLGKHLALRLPVDLVAAGSDDRSFASLGFTPGLLYRFRSSNDQRFVPYLGGGLKLGFASAGVGLLGLPSSSTYALSRASLNGFDLDDLGDGDSSSSNIDSRDRFGVFPEVWAGVEWTFFRLLVLDLGLNYTYHRLDHRGVHQLGERIGLRFAF